MRRNPSHSVRVPKSRIISSTESSAMSNRLSTIREKISASCRTTHWYKPDSEATMKKASQSRSEEHTSELQSLMRISYAVFCLKKKKIKEYHRQTKTHTKHLRY